MHLHEAELSDAVQLHKTYPATFEIPDSDVTLSLKIGDVAKVAHRRERFWVQIVKVISKGEYVGRIDNDLLSKELRYGMLIALSHNNIYAVWGDTKSS